MSELLEFLLNGVLEVALDLCDLGSSWRFFLPVLGALGVVSLICWTVSNRAAQLVLAVPVGIAGLISGIVWQVRKG
jgi:hypothetical protein